MIVSLSEDCPLLRADCQVSLVALLGTVARGQNLIATPPPDRLAQLIPPAVWSIYRDHIMQSYKQIVNSPQYWARHSSCGSCEPECVSNFYASPTIIIVENLTTDGAWLVHVASTTRPRIRRNFSDAMAHIHLEQAGGIGEIPKIIRARAATYARLRPQGDVPLKVVAFADSDSRSPGANSTDGRRVLDAAQEFGADAHLTAKRSIENYIPDEALHVYMGARRDRSTAATFVTSLRPPARDHYPIKDGLTANELSMSAGMYPYETPCRLGMGDFIADLLGSFGYSVTAGGLQLRDGQGELERLLDIIERNL